MPQTTTDDGTQPTRAPRTQARRLVVILLLGGLVISIAPAIDYFWFTRPIGTGPAGPSVSRAPFRSPWTTQPVTLIGIGDSITAGLGSSPGHSYFERLVQNPPDEFENMQGICLSTVLPGLTFENLAVSGTTSLQHMQRQIPELDRGFPDTLGIVVLTTGGNDIIHDYGRSPPCEGAMYGATRDRASEWINAYRRRLSLMLDRIESAFPDGCHIFLADIYDPTDGRGDVQSAGLPAWPDGASILAAYNEIIHAAANDRPNVHVIELHDMFLGHGLHCTKPWTAHYSWSDPHYWYFENLEDPNDRGYDAIRRLFLIKIAEVLAG